MNSMPAFLGKFQTSLPAHCRVLQPTRRGDLKMPLPGESSSSTPAIGEVIMYTCITLIKHLLVTFAGAPEVYHKCVGDVRGQAYIYIERSVIHTQ